MERLNKSEEVIYRSEPFYAICRNCIGGMDILEDLFGFNGEYNNCEVAIYILTLTLSNIVLYRLYDSFQLLLWNSM